MRFSFNVTAGADNLEKTIECFQKLAEKYLCILSDAEVRINLSEISNNAVSEKIKNAELNNIPKKVVVDNI